MRRDYRASPVPSIHVHAAVHVQRRARDVGGLRTGQERHRVGDVFRLAQAAQRDLAQQRFVLAFAQGLGHVGIDEARRHAVDGDVAAADLARQRAASCRPRRPWRPHSSSGPGCRSTPPPR